LIDSSSAILLFKAGWASIAARAWRLMVPPSVARELTVARRTGAADFLRMMAAGWIQVKAPETSTTAVDRSRMGQGEKDVLRLYHSGCGAFIIVDDGRAAGFCRDRSIPYTNALLVPRILALAGEALPCDWHAGMAALSRLGRYSEAVRRYARDCPDWRLAAFKP
jgi:hypothetical protein